MRQLRAVLVLATAWALVWLPMGLGLALYADARPPQPSDVIYRPIAIPLFVAVWTAWGWISGGVFAAVLGRAERRRRLEELSLLRTALWGAVGSTALPTVLLAIDMVRSPFSPRLYDWQLALVAVAVSAGLGAACGAGTLTVARRAK